MSNRFADEKRIEKQIGCITGCFHIFDRLQILTSNRLHYTDRFPSSPVVDTMTSETDSSVSASPSTEWPEGSPFPELRSLMAGAPESPPKSPLPFPTFEFKGVASSSRRFWREAPRLSLDSRANTDAEGSLHPKEICTGGNIPSSATGETPQRWSPSIIARLMGLEASENEKTPELRRSASESRASTGFFHAQTVENGRISSSDRRTQSQSAQFNSIAKDSQPLDTTPKDYFPRNVNKAEPPKGLNRDSFNSHSPWRAQPPRKVFDSRYFFPEPKRVVSSYAGIEKNEHTKDLETLKQILEALQLKGLLHSGKQSDQNQLTRRNFVYEESPIVATEPSRTPLNRRTGNDCSPSNVSNQCRGGLRRNRSSVGGNSPSRSPRREGNAQSPITTGRSPTRGEGNAGGRRSSLPAKPKPQRMNRLAEGRRVSLVQPPKVNPRRTGPIYLTVNKKSPWSSSPKAVGIQKEKITTVVAAEDESSSSSVSGSSATTSTDTEKEGRNVLVRCDKLIHTTAKMATNDMHPSPVSVLDPSFDKDEVVTPSPVTLRRSIDFEDGCTEQCDELDDGMFSHLVSPAQSSRDPTSDEAELVYIRASPEGSVNAFPLLIFDAVNEIVDRHRVSAPNYNYTKPSLDKVQSEFERIRENGTANDLYLFDGILKKDVATSPWSQVVLGIERMVFKDLITETIRDLAMSSSTRK